MKYRKKPVVINAFQWGMFIGVASLDQEKFFQEAVCEKAHDGYKGAAHIHTLEGIHDVIPGDFIIKGVKGEFYPCKPDIFAMTYEPVDDCACSLDGKRNPVFQSHSEFECSNSDGGVLKA